MCLRQWLPVEGHLSLLHRAGAGHWRCWGQAPLEVCAPVTWAVSAAAKSFRDKQGLSGASGSLSLYRMHLLFILDEAGEGNLSPPAYPHPKWKNPPLGQRFLLGVWPRQQRQAATL